MSRPTTYTIGNVTAGDGASYTYDPFARMATATKLGASFSYGVRQSPQTQLLLWAPPLAMKRFKALPQKA